MHKLYYYKGELYFHYCTIDGTDVYLLFHDIPFPYEISTCGFNLDWSEITSSTNISHYTTLRDIAKKLLNYKNNIYYCRRDGNIFFTLNYDSPYQSYIRFNHRYMKATRQFEEYRGQFININDNPIYELLNSIEQDNILELIFQGDINLAASILNI